MRDFESNDFDKLKVGDPVRLKAGGRLARVSAIRTGRYGHDIEVMVDGVRCYVDDEDIEVLTILDRIVIAEDDC